MDALRAVQTAQDEYFGKHARTPTNHSCAPARRRCWLKTPLPGVGTTASR